MNDQKTQALIKQHEGYREKVYLDTKGIPTGGWGHAFHVDSPLTQEICELLFEQDYNNTKTDASKFVSVHMLDHLSPVRTAVIVDMMYNLGYVKLSKFKRFIKALQKKDYDLAAKEMIDSKWYTDVKSRADRLIRMMKTNKW